MKQTRRQIEMDDSWEPEDGAQEHEARKFPRAVALEVAAQLGAVLQAQCVTFPGEARPWLRVVGSVRRYKPEVKDLEFSFVPAVVKIRNRESLLGELVEASGANVMLDALVAAGVIVKRLNVNGHATWGADIRLAVHVATGLPVDFFAATKENRWNQLVCRTGGKISNTEICNAAIKLGLKWATTSAGFECRRTGRILKRPASEQDVFQMVGMEYKEPRDRK